MTGHTYEDHAFREYLRTRTDEFGILGAKREQWIDYMSDASRGAELSRNMVAWLGVSPRADLKVLDLGCGYGNALLGLSEDFTSVSGLDIEDDRVEWSARRVPGADVRAGSVTDLPWPDDTFDLIVSTDVFEHVDHQLQEQGAREIARTLKPGGHAFVSVPNLFQLIDEHNKVPFGSWLPNEIRGRYVARFSRGGTYVQCWERSVRTWGRIFANAGLTVRTEVTRPRGIRFFPANRVLLYMEKPA